MKIYPQPQAETEVQFRWMVRRDLPAVLEIERQSFEYAWTEEDFLRCLEQRNCVGTVVRVDDQIVGYMIYQMHKNRIHLLNFAVAPQWRRKGVGTQMIQRLKKRLVQQGRQRITLEVRETNLPAQLFFRHCGFRAICVLHGFYENTTEDAYLMQYRHRPSLKEQPAPENRRLAG